MVYCVMIDGIVGEIILFTLRKCCGDSFTTAAHYGWAKILSRMLDVILPVVVKYEVENAEMVHEKFAARFYGVRAPPADLASARTCPNTFNHSYANHHSNPKQSQAVSSCPHSEPNSVSTKAWMSRDPSFA